MNDIFKVKVMFHYKLSYYFFFISLFNAQKEFDEEMTWMFWLAAFR